MVDEAPVGDPDAVGGLASVRDGDLLGTLTAPKGRVRADRSSAALRVVCRLIVVGEGETERDPEPYTRVLGRGS